MGLSQIKKKLTLKFYYQLGKANHYERKKKREILLWIKRIY